MEKRKLSILNPEIYMVAGYRWLPFTLQCHLYHSQAKTAKAVEQIFCPGKERPRRLADGKSRGLDAARAKKMPTESLV
jgi:hypothetical protein